MSFKRGTSFSNFSQYQQDSDSLELEDIGDQQKLGHHQYFGFPQKGRGGMQRHQSQSNEFSKNLVIINILGSHKKVEAECNGIRARAMSSAKTWSSSIFWVPTKRSRRNATASEPEQ